MIEYWNESLSENAPIEKSLVAMISKYLWIFEYLGVAGFPNFDTPNFV